jgi:short-subunit dehydrogenase
MTKHALQAMGSAMRAELAPAGIDVALLNPGPFAAGFNDRMIDDPGDFIPPDMLARMGLDKRP